MTSAAQTNDRPQDRATSLGSFPERINVAARLVAQAAEEPERAAVIAPESARFSRRTRWRTTSAAELDRRCDEIAHGLAHRGLTRGDRVALFVRPGADLVAITFALFKLGAVPVLIDPGIGRQALVRAVARVLPRAFVGVPEAHLLRALHARELSSIDLWISTGPRWLPGATTLDELVRDSASSNRVFEPLATRADEPAAILFTSGSTGPPKGVVYTHGMFEAQVRALAELYALTPGEVDLACFPWFALFDVALGITSVFPPLDASRPARCDPEKIVAAIEAHAPTLTFGSPAIWRRVVPWCLEHGRKLPSLKRVMIAGAPVPLELVAGFQRLLEPGADVHTPYGATECLPLTSISGRELAGSIALETESGAGTCVGRAAPGIELALIAIGDEPIAGARGIRRVARGELGEICARGAVVTREYAFDPAETALAKIADGASIWHRTGDVGWIDEDARLWFCGRKAHRLETQNGLVMPVPSENVYNLHPRVRRSALVGLGERGSERPVLVVELREGGPPEGRDARRAFFRELCAMMRQHGSKKFPPRLAEIEAVFFHPDFPVDPRHNAKIRREDLKRWAEEQPA